MKRIATAACVVVAFLMLLQGQLFGMSEKARLLEHFLYGNALTYRGTLTVVVKSDGVEGVNTLAAFVRKRADLFEKEHFGIFLSVVEAGETDLDAQAAAADLLILPSEAAPAFEPRAQRYGGGFPLPLMAGMAREGPSVPLYQNGTVMLLNEEALYRMALTLPAGIDGMDEAWLAALLAQGEKALAFMDMKSLMATMVSQLPDDVKRAALKGSEQSFDAWLKGDCALWIGSQEALWLLHREELLNHTLPAYHSYPLSGFSGRLQVALIMEPEVEANAAMQAFVRSLIGKSAQSQLHTLYALPVVEGAVCQNPELAPLWLAAGEVHTIGHGVETEEFRRRWQQGDSVSALAEYVRSACQEANGRVK